MKRGIILPLLFFGLLSNSLVGAQSVSFTSSPKISILEPKNGATYPDDTITVSFSVTSPAAQKDSTPYPADSVLITCTTGSQEVFSYRLTFENVPPEIQKSFTLTNLGNGAHTLNLTAYYSAHYTVPLSTQNGPAFKILTAGAHASSIVTFTVGTVTIPPKPSIPPPTHTPSPSLSSSPSPTPSPTPEPTQTLEPTPFQTHGPLPKQDYTPFLILVATFVTVAVAAIMLVYFKKHKRS